MTEITPADIRRNAAWIYTDVARQLLCDPDDFGGLSDETVRLLDRLGRVVYGLVETLADRDDAAAHAADGKPRRRAPYMEISPEDAEHIVTVVDQMFEHAGDRKSAAHQAAHKPRAVA